MVKKTLKERNPVLLGLIGVVVAASLLFGSLNINRIMSLLGDGTYTAEFTDAGGTRSGDDVRVNGVPVGSVQSVRLHGDRVVVTFRAHDVLLGNETRAQVKSDNALGSKFLALTPGGSGSARHIPVSRTDPGYAVSEVLGQATRAIEKIDVDQLARSFESVGAAMDVSPEEFAQMLKGVSALSKMISSRDEEIGDLLGAANDISGTLADRNQQIVALMGAGSRIFSEVANRQATVGEVFRQVTEATEQLRLLAKENGKTLGPNLLEVKRLADTLAKYRDDLAYTVQTIPMYIRSLGESIASGPYFQANVANLTSPETLLSVDNIIQDVLRENAGSGQR